MKLSEVWSAARERPRRAFWVGLTSVAALSLIAVGIGVAAAPDPTVRTLPMAWQRSAAPVVNTGVDAQGMTLDQYVASGKDSRTWRPVETSTVRAGGAFFTLRYQEFRNKMAEPKIQRFLLCGKVTGTTVDNDGMTPFDLGAVDAPTRTDGAAVKNHPTRVPDYIGRDANGAPLAQPRTCIYKAYAKFIKNPVQAVEIQFAPVAVTILPPTGAPGTTGGK